MNPRWNYLIKPEGKEYNNTKKIAGQDFIVNTTIEDAKFCESSGYCVCASPEGSEIKEGSRVVVHHNVFRTYLDMKG